MEIKGDLKKYKSIFILLGFITVILVGITDFVTNYRLGFSIFYLVPIMIVTWIYGKKFGILLSITSSLIWLFLELFTKQSSITSIMPYLSASMRFIIFFSVTYLLSIQSELEKSLRIEKKLARKDILTGAANRRLFFELAEIEIRRSKRYKHPFTLAYIDLDNFKKVNDTQGHNAGDKVLKVVVETIHKNIREIDLVARLSGDEFVILLPETNLQQAKIVIDRTQKGLLFAMQKHSWPVTFSIGVITFEKVPSTTDEMVKVADNLMYEVKKSGKNMVKYDIYQRQE